MTINREDAKKLLEKHVKDSYQLLHAEMVANALEKLAESLAEDRELWYVAGLLHDLDFDEFPKEHPMKSIEWLKELNYPEELIRAVAAHGYMFSNVTPETKLDKMLLACDEISGFLYAYSLMRPTGFDGMKASKVLKKLKDRSFAPNINREEVEYAFEISSFDPAEHIKFLIGVFAEMDLRKV